MFHFYCFNQNKTIVISDLPVDKVRNKFGLKYEIVNSVKEKESIPVLISRLSRSYPSFTFSYLFKRPKPFFSDEQRKKISAAKMGKPRDPETRAKISAALKGRSNFQGKRHTDETKEKMAAAKMGNQHVKDTVWAHDPRGDAELRVKDLRSIPAGFSKGRDYYSTEPGLYYFKNKD